VPVFNGHGGFARRRRLAPHVRRYAAIDFLFPLWKKNSAMK
jgi:hypothetical protein